jgi:hypothetical protein
MTTHLDKATAALDDAASLVTTPETLSETTLPPRLFRLLDIARVQAEVAQAEALTRIADMMEEDRRHRNARLQGTGIVEHRRN